MAGTRKKAFGFDNLIDWLEGDRIIWIIVFAIIMFSIVGMASSTSLLAKLNSASRFDYAIQQVYISFGGLVLIWLICKFGRVGILKFLSRLGFIGSALLLILLDSHFQGIPFLTPVETQPGSGTWRTIIMFGVPVMVYEVVKVAMVMYLAWALQTLKQKETQLADKLAAFGWLRFLSTEEGKVMFYVGAPMVIVFLLELAGSNSSAIFLGLVMGFTVIVGKMKFKYIFHLILAGVIALGLVFGMQKITGWKFLTRVTTAISRVSDFHGDPVKELHKHEPGTLAFQRILDSSKQVTSAKVAVSTGGLLGKGPGKSTQRYIVSVMYEDYMFSFIRGVWPAGRHADSYALWHASGQRLDHCQELRHRICQMHSGRPRRSHFLPGPAAHSRQCGPYTDDGAELADDQSRKQFVPVLLHRFRSDSVNQPHGEEEDCEGDGERDEECAFRYGRRDQRLIE